MSWMDSTVAFVEKNSAIIAILAFILSVIPAFVSLRSSFDALRSVRNLRHEIDDLEQKYSFTLNGFKKDQYREIVKFVYNYDKLSRDIIVNYSKNDLDAYRLFVEAFSKLNPKEKAEVVEIVKGESPRVQEMIIRHLFDSPNYIIKSYSNH